MAIIPFANSSFDSAELIVVPMILARRDKAYWIATVCTISSVLGGMLGYAIGMFLYDSVGQWLIRFYGMGEGIEQFREQFRIWGTEIILIKGLTPIPFKLVTIASGIAAFSFPAFVAAALVTRGARFFLIAWLLSAMARPAEFIGAAEPGRLGRAALRSALRAGGVIDRDVAARNAVPHRPQPFVTDNRE